MKHNNTNILRTLTTTLMLFVSIVIFAQEIHFTFANAQNTNDGENDFFEVDVMIQTINTSGTFKLGSGQLYFNYNTVAFGTNVFASSGISITQPNPDYICGQYVDDVAAGIYYSFTINDNTTSKVSWAFSQFYASATFDTDNVNDTSTKLCHLKFTYTNPNEDPMILFEDGDSFDDQFYTACGPDTGGILEPVNCTGFPGTQLLIDTFDSSGATLSNKNFERLTGISVYPNPTKGILNIRGDVSKLEQLIIFSITGKYVMEVKENFSEINISSLQSAIYFVRLSTAESTGTFKIIKE